MDTALVVVFLLIAMALIGLVLIQQGKGADAGAAFGSGASSTVFGARGSASFLTRTTGVLAALFFILALVLSVYGVKGAKQQSVLDRVAPIEAPAAVVPSGPADVPTLPLSPGVTAPPVVAPPPAPVSSAPAPTSAPVKK
ncbi:MAG: preprotein translocase subunit SecG [Gammaproteobacteria bacterium]|nr:preprotein translocase subunit SecG [Gammaproteobacteria bacterium]